MPYETVIYERRGRIVYITMNRPNALNAFNFQQHADLPAALAEFDRDEEGWVCILQGAGRCFSAGADVKEVFSSPRDKRMGKPGQHEGPGAEGPEGTIGSTGNWKPVIAAVHGYCLGHAFGLALQCDLITASEDAKFGIGEVKRGLDGAEEWAKLQWFMPSKVTTEMLLTSEIVPASELYRLGLINRLVPVGQHVQAAEELAQKILQAPPLAVRAGVRLSRYPWVGRVAEAELYCKALHLSKTEDFKESTRAFVEKREPHYHGR